MVMNIVYKIALIQSEITPKSVSTKIPLQILATKAAKTPYASAQQFFDLAVQRIDRAKFYALMQQSKLISRQLHLGVVYDVPVLNVPQEFEVKQLEKQLVKTAIKVKNETLMWSKTVQNVIILDNPRNQVYFSACVAAYPQFDTLLIIGFQYSDRPIDYVEVMSKLEREMHANSILTNPKMNLNYVPEVIPEEVTTQFAGPDHILIKKQQYKILQNPNKQSDDHKLCIVAVLSPIFPTFEHNLQILYQIQQAFENILVWVSVLGSDSVNHTQVAKKSPIYQYLNVAEKILMDSDPKPPVSVEKKLIITDANKAMGRRVPTEKPLVAHDDELFYQLWDLKPVPNADYTIKSTRKGFAEVLFNTFQSISETQELNKLIKTDTNIHALITDLETVTNINVNRAEFSTFEDKVSIFGVQSKMKTFGTQLKLKYSCVVLTKNINCEPVLKTLLGQDKLNQKYPCNCYVLFQGIWEANARNAEKNALMSQLSLIYDSQNLFRVTNDICGQKDEHILLFDENGNIICKDLIQKDIVKVIEKYEKQNEKLDETLQNKTLFQTEKEEVVNDNLMPASDEYVRRIFHEYARDKSYVSLQQLEQIFDKYKLPFEDTKQEILDDEDIDKEKIGLEYFQSIMAVVDLKMTKDEYQLIEQEVKLEQEREFQLKSIFDTIDMNHNGSLSYDEVEMITKMNDIKVKNLKVKFQQYLAKQGKDEAGIDYSSFKKLMDEVGWVQSK